MRNISFQTEGCGVNRNVMRRDVKTNAYVGL
jgi:hypothetical protein